MKWRIEEEVKYKKQGNKYEKVSSFVLYHYVWLLILVMRVYLLDHKNHKVRFKTREEALKFREENLE